MIKLNCGNALTVLVPALGNSYSPRFTAKGGSAITGQGGDVTVVPNSKEVELTVYSGNDMIGTRTFSVRPIPAVEIQAFTDRGPVDISKGMPRTTARLTLQAIPDAGFLEFLPDDIETADGFVKVNYLSKWWCWKSFCESWTES